MFLSDTDIIKAIESGKLTVKDFDETRLQPASYDVQLGNKFVITEFQTKSFIDPVKGVFPEIKEVNVENDGEFVLHPGFTVLGTLRDYVGSDDYLIQLSGKSSLARIGLIVHNTAGLINPGHYLNITLELYNLNHIPIILRPGMDIAQLTFSTISSPMRRNYKQTGRFNGDNWGKNFTTKK